MNCSQYTTCFLTVCNSFWYKGNNWEMKRCFTAAHFVTPYQSWLIPDLIYTQKPTSIGQLLRVNRKHITYSSPDGRSSTSEGDKTANLITSALWLCGWGTKGLAVQADYHAQHEVMFYPTEIPQRPLHWDMPV